MTTRRKFGMGIAAMLAAQRAPAALVRSLIAGRHIAATGTRLYDAEVAYLESTGMQYIDPGIRNISVTSSFLVDFRVQFPAVPSSGYFGSGRTTNSSVQTFYAINSSSSTGLYMAFNGRTSGSIASNLSVDKTSWHDVSASASEGTVEYFFDSSKVLSTTFTSFQIGAFALFRMFGDSISSGAIYGAGRQRISKARLVVEGNELFNFIPVRFTNELGQSEGAMYDRVSGQLFRNKGTGSFIIGPAKARGALAQNGGGGGISG